MSNENFPEKRKKPKDTVKCLKCEFPMNNLNDCHLICSNCGSHMDCSDKGCVW